jgi:hypothetical protein
MGVLVVVVLLLMCVGGGGVCCCIIGASLQVLIPDVQKLINQLGNVNTDLFASKLLRPPSSVLLLPLRASGVGKHALASC